MIKEKRSVFLFMDERIIEQLENVPYDGEDAYLELRQLCDLKAKTVNLSEEENARLNYELDLIKKWGIAKLFLFGYNLCINDGLGVSYSIEGNSYVNYLLGISKVNPTKYNLNFERFFNEYRKILPSYHIVVEKGNVGKTLKSIYDKYGANLFTKSKEDNDIYFVLSKPINTQLIKESRIVARLNEESYKERVSVLSYMDLSRLGYYNFSINELKGIEYSTQDRFSEDEIYQKAKSLLYYKIHDMSAPIEIAQVKEILANTEYKLVYQEQIVEILNKLCGFDISKSDFMFREIVKARKDSIVEVQKILLEKYGDKGQRLIDYLCKIAKYTTSKAYVIATLYTVHV